MKWLYLGLSWAVILMLVWCCCNSDEITGTPRLLWGDVNGDAVVDTTDAQIIVAVCTGSAVYGLALIKACGDVDGDNTISLLDAWMIMAWMQGTRPAGRVGERCL